MASDRQCGHDVRFNWTIILLNVLLVCLQLLAGMGIYALNLRFEVVEQKISAVNQRLEDHIHAERPGSSVIKHPRPSLESLAQETGSGQVKPSPSSSP